MWLRYYLGDRVKYLSLLLPFPSWDWQSVTDIMKSSLNVHKNDGTRDRHPMIKTDNWKRTACRSCGPSVNYSEGNSWDRSLVFGLASCRSIWCCVFVIKYSFWKCRFNIVIDAFNVLSRLVIDFPSQSDTFYFSFQWIFEETLKTLKSIIVTCLFIITIIFI